jgi:hypothetical protein
LRQFAQEKEAGALGLLAGARGKEAGALGLFAGARGKEAGALGLLAGARGKEAGELGQLAAASSSTRRGARAGRMAQPGSARCKIDVTHGGEGDEDSTGDEPPEPGRTLAGPRVAGYRAGSP